IYARNKTMARTTQEPPVSEVISSRPADPLKTNPRWSGYAHLLLARMRELQREPEVIFWIYVFAVLLALGLGIVFRSKPIDVTDVAIISRPGATRVLDLLKKSRSEERRVGKECRTR